MTLWEYAGGVDELRNVKVVFDPETQSVVMESQGAHWSGARR